jgi:cobalt/nickel transport system permease protein
MKQIDTLAYTNRLQWMAPQQKLLFAITLLIISSFVHPQIQILITIWVTIWIIGYAKIPVRTYLQLLYIPILFWLTSLPALAINIVNSDRLHSIQNDSLYGLTISNYYIYLSHLGIQQGLEIITRALASTSCLYLIILTVPFTELLQILRHTGCPTLLCDILLLMYRFIFVLLNTANELLIAQKARSGYQTFTTSIKSLALLIGQLLKRTLENYHQLSLTITSRGFNGEFRVWRENRYHYSPRHALESIIGVLILITLNLCAFAPLRDASIPPRI